MLFQGENDHLAHYVIEKSLRNHYVKGFRNRHYNYVTVRNRRYNYVTALCNYVTAVT